MCVCVYSSISWLTFSIPIQILDSPWTARRSNQSILKEISPSVHWKDWCWSWNSNTLATSCKELTHLKRPRCWERLRAGGEWDDRGWDGWMASPTRWAWVWVDSGSWWWTGRPGMLQFMGSQRVGHDWVNELNWSRERRRSVWSDGVMSSSHFVLYSGKPVPALCLISLTPGQQGLHWSLLCIISPWSSQKSHEIDFMFYTVNRWGCWAFNR